MSRQSDKRWNDAIAPFRVDPGEFAGDPEAEEMLEFIATAKAAGLQLGQYMTRDERGDSLIDSERLITDAKDVLLGRSADDDDLFRGADYLAVVIVRCQRCERVLDKLGLRESSLNLAQRWLPVVCRLPERGGSGGELALTPEGARKLDGGFFGPLTYWCRGCGRRNIQVSRQRLFNLYDASARAENGMRLREREEHRRSNRHFIPA